MLQFENKSIEEIWSSLGDVPVNHQGEIEEVFLSYPIGTDREDIWTDIEYHYDASVAHMFFGKSLKS